jgi:hypothetical protein
MVSSIAPAIGFVVLILLIGGLVTIFGLIIAGIWKVFVKAGQHGWVCLIPIYSAVVMCRIVKRPAWWVLLFFIPVVNLVTAVLIYLDLARAFRRDEAFGVLTIFFPWIMLPILGFSSAEYDPGFTNIWFTSTPRQNASQRVQQSAQPFDL